LFVFGIFFPVFLHVLLLDLVCREDHAQAITKGVANVTLFRLLRQGPNDVIGVVSLEMPAAVERLV
jgi:hypothetical protein